MSSSPGTEKWTWRKPAAAWFDAVSKDRPGAANRAFEILRSLMFRAEEYGFRELGTNPCLGIRKNPRRDIGDNAIALPDSKTGPRSVPLGGAARSVIKALPEPRDPDAYLFPSLDEARETAPGTNSATYSDAATAGGRC